MKKLTILISIMLFGIILQAQNCESYFPQKIKKKYIYTDYNKKDKVIGSSEKTVLEKNNISGGVEVKISETSKDKDGDNPSTNEYTIKCENGVFTMDMESYLNQEQMKAYEGMDVAVDADNLTIPENAKAGDALNSGKVVATISNEGMQIMTMTVNISDRKVEAIESITTSAGTFECLKITSTVELKTILVFRTTVTEWHTKGVGIVKSESYSKSGKLISKTVLTGME